MSAMVIIFFFFMILAASSAISILFINNVFKAALLLLVCLLSLAGLYVISSAEFVAVTQIMIYAGGVLVVIIFGIMLTTRMAGKPLQTGNANIIGGLVIAAGLGIIFVPLLIERFGHQKTTGQFHGNAVTETGTQLMSTFVLPFEIAGILLLVSLIGAAVLSSVGSKNNSSL
jgi:NADH:ubiquinone oxidoreductase subunit 6 (subunit J)